MKGRLIVMMALLIAGAACAGSATGDDAAARDVDTTVENSVPEASATDDPATDADPPSTDTPTSHSEDLATSTTESGSTVATNPPDKSEPTPSTTSPPSSGTDIDPGLAPLVGLAKVDLGDRLGVGPAAIAVISAELVEWPDTSLGCPQPGMAYTQIPTDGSLIVLAHDSVEYRYHTGGSASTPFLCE